MKISNPMGNAGLGSVEGPKKDRVDISQKDAGLKKPSSGDIHSSARVDVSDRAQEMNRIRAEATRSDEIDAAKVAHFQKLIDEGNYKVDAQSVADRLVDEHLMLS